MPSVSEDFWSTSTYEMDNNGLQSQRSISSRSTCVQTHDLHVAGNASNPPDFVNHGESQLIYVSSPVMISKHKETFFLEASSVFVRIKTTISKMEENGQVSIQMTV